MSCQLSRLVACALIAWPVTACRSLAAQPAAPAPRTAELANRHWQLRVSTGDDQVRVRFQNKQLHFCLADGPYSYRAELDRGQNPESCQGLRNAQVTASAGRLVVRGQLAGLELEHRFELPRNRPYLEERIILHNRTDRLISLPDFEAGVVRRVADPAGQVSAEVAPDRWVAGPLRARIG